MLIHLRSIFFSFLLVFSIVDAGEKKQTICLNMIIKDESKVIERCLKSVKPVIDYWVIVDTGSTDGTQKIVKDFMKDIPGELHERPWKNFSHNRNEALQLAKGKADYVLIIDADEVLKYEDGFKLPVLNKDFYYIITSYGNMRYDRNQLFKDALNWKWDGVVHEVLVSPEAKTFERLEKIANYPSPDGARSRDPRKYYKDAELLETALLEDPNSTRTAFYLAQSYRDAGEHELALKNYEKRVAMGGWDQEVFWSMLQIARLEQGLKRSEDIVANDYFRAFHNRPSRAEPLYSLANYYRMNNNFPLAYAVAKKGITIPIPNDVLFIEKNVYDYGMLLEFSVAAYYLGKYEISKEASEQILAKEGIPDDIRELVKRNLDFANKGITSMNLTKRLLNKADPVLN